MDFDKQNKKEGRLYGWGNGEINVHDQKHVCNIIST
jgi:hypothetical protein